MVSTFKKELYPKPKLGKFYALSQNTNTYLKNNIRILKQIGCVTQKSHQILSRPSGYSVIDQNVQHIILINNLRTAWSTQILVPFCSSSDNLLQYNHIMFSMSC